MTNLICIGCPRGCHLQVDEENGYAVSGNRCPIGAKYGKEELANPTRTLTTTVRLEGGLHEMLPVRTDKPLPKGKLMEAMQLINQVKVKAPVKMHQVIIENILDTGVNIISSKEM